MKLGPVTKLDERNKATSKKFSNEVMPVNSDVIAILLIYGQFGGVRKPNFGCIFCKTYLSLKVIFHRRKTELKHL